MCQTNSINNVGTICNHFVRFDYLYCNHQCFVSITLPMCYPQLDYLNPTPRPLVFTITSCNTNQRVRKGRPLSRCSHDTSPRTSSPTTFHPVSSTESDLQVLTRYVATYIIAYYLPSGDIAFLIALFMFIYILCLSICAMHISNNFSLSLVIHCLR